MNQQSSKGLQHQQNINENLFCHPDCYVCAFCGKIIPYDHKCSLIGRVNIVCESCLNVHSKPKQSLPSITDFGLPLNTVKRHTIANGSSLLSVLLTTIKFDRIDDCSSKKTRSFKTEFKRSKSENCSRKRYEKLRSLVAIQSASTQHFADFERTANPNAKPQYRAFLMNEIDVLEEMGQGFYGIVRKVVDRKNGQVMIMKEIREITESSKKTFRKEIQLLRRIDHPNILSFIGVIFQAEDRLSFIVEYASGGSIKNTIRDARNDFPWRTRVSFAKDIADGMNYLHELRIIHRDLNSNNCLVKENGRVVVADFGLSHVLADSDNYCVRKRKGKLMHLISRTDPDDEDVEQMFNNIVGSPYWMAPEMLKNKRYDHRVDIFSYGIVLCEIIGRVDADPDYLPRTSDFGLNTKMFKENLCSPQCPPNFLAVALSCCEIDPDKRPSFANILPRLIALYLKSNAR